MRILRSSNYQSMPWKNGGGVTNEIAAFPEKADLASFGWRISMAVVSSNGLFSTFPEIDRTLTILDGDGLWLTLGELERRRLDQLSEPLFFPADIPTSADLVSSPVTDLNVMTRRSVFTHRVQKLIYREPLVLTLTADVSVIFCAAGAIEIMSQGEATQLAQNDCALFQKSDATSCTLQGSGKAYLIEIAAVQ
jgi:uncharacterized protein